MKINISMCFAVQLVLCALPRIARPAPITTTTNAMDDDFNNTVETSWSLIKKVIDDIPGTHEACITVKGMTLDPNDDLFQWEYVANSIGIPSAPSLALPSTSVSETLSQILAGLQLHKGVLEAVKDRLSSPGRVKLLLADLEDLLVQINMALQHLNIPPPVEPAALNVSKLTDYEVQVMTHMTLARLQRFGQEAFRFLRSLLPNDP